MAGRCLDSDFLIDLLRGEEKAASAAERLDQLSGELCTTAVNAYEILYGAHRSNRAQNVAEARVLLGRLAVLSLDRRAADIAAATMADLASRGSMVELRDVLVASIALAHQCAVVTRNRKHFAKIKGLRVEQW